MTETLLEDEIKKMPNVEFKNKFYSVNIKTGMMINTFNPKKHIKLKSINSQLLYIAEFKFKNNYYTIEIYPNKNNDYSIKSKSKIIKGLVPILKC